ncbi:hypothetical protein M408DRAFT_147283 [Serendipita vermifera MAFF 305830]|uniref:Uncharacterized protein n=1 Tax=Serendipita vermifera MAFF 305830 TaxID=933852 RepID=A0A0C2WP63_SERVB|nr:hypothetical protein M408DRAFT_147283 [Serendipita vermifera MAFF 305830]
MHPIRRLLVDAKTSQYDSLFTRALEGSPGVLTHLIFQYSPRITEIVPQFSSYLGRLQHVGTLPDFKAPNTAVPLQSYLDTLASLPCLVSLDAVSGKTRWDHDTIALVNKSLRNLQRVMVHRAQCYVWELQRGIWKKRNVASFSTWDIIRGACN